MASRMGGDDCSDSLRSSAASEDAIEMPETFASPDRLNGAVCLLLDGLGENATRDGLRDTPKRVAKAWIAASEGYTQRVHSVLGGALFHEEVSGTAGQGMVLIRDVDFASTSEFDLLPFFGRCHIAYIPRSGVVLGLSKVARLAKMFAKRFQEQQRFTCQILEAFNAEVQPLGCAAIVEAQHLSQMPSKPHLTFAALGCFYAKPQLYMQEFGILLGRPDLSGALQACKVSECKSAEDNSSPFQAHSTNGSSECSTSGPMVAAVESMLAEIGENPRREGLRGSADRYVQHLVASTSGSEHSSREDSGIDFSQQMAAALCRQHLVQCFQMQFTSQCEHHLLPFHGTVQIVNFPSSSRQLLDEKLARQIVNRFSRRLQIQERLTHQIGHELFSSLQSSGLLLVCRAAHMCMVARGVEQHASTTMTCIAFGKLQDNHGLRAKALLSLQSLASIVPPSA